MLLTDTVPDSDTAGASALLVSAEAVAQVLMGTEWFAQLRAEVASK